MIQVKDGLGRCRIPVDRSRSPSEILDATSCRICMANGSIAAIPRGQGDVVSLVLFDPDRYRGEFALADPYSVIALNMVYPRLVNDYSNTSSWEGVNGNVYHITFHRHYGKRFVLLDRNIISVDAKLWHVGIEK